MNEVDLMRSVYEKHDAYQFRDFKADGDVNASPRLLQIQRLVGEHKRVLDVGISYGEFALWLSKNGNEVVGIDISEKSVELCRARGLKAYRVNIETEPLPDLGLFDVVLMLEIIEHLIDPLPVLRKLRTVLKPSGVLILSTPNAAYVKWRLQLLCGNLPDFGENRAALEEPRPYNLVHKTPLTIPDLERVLSLATFGLACLEPEEYDASGVWGRFGLRHMRAWLRRRWPYLFAGAVVVEASAR